MGREWDDGSCTYTFDTPISHFLSKNNCLVEIDWIYMAHNSINERIFVLAAAIFSLPI